jgi:hypothetical protein
MWNASVTGVLGEIGNAVNTTGSKLLATANSPGFAPGMAIIAVTGLTFLLISGLFTLEVQEAEAERAALLRRASEASVINLWLCVCPFSTSVNALTSQIV